jgi:hypothetical protein
MAGRGMTETCRYYVRSVSGVSFNDDWCFLVRLLQGIHTAGSIHVSAVRLRGTHATRVANLKILITR